MFFFLQSSRLVFHGSRWVFIVIHAFRLDFMVIHGSTSVFHDSRLIFRVFIVPGWFIYVYIQAESWRSFFHGSRLILNGFRSVFMGF